MCSNPQAQDGTACNDGNSCTQTDTCQSGACVGSNPVVCTASDQCHIAGTCNTATGVCSNPQAQDGTACNDGDACTQTDICQSGACVGSNPVVCAASDQCHVPGTCNTATGVCSNPSAPNGTPCNDGDACTRTDACQSGACVGSDRVVCSAIDPCHLAGTCSPASGECSTPVAPDGTGCNDGNACTQTDVCQGGVCVGTNPTICGPSDPCHLAGTCNEITGACSNPPAPDGTTCNDGDACTTGDACANGACAGSLVGPPAEVSNQRFLTNTTDTWDRPAPAGPTPAYDLARGSLGQWPTGSGSAETCLGQQIEGNQATITDVPGTGSGYWYLVRARTACGIGTYGTASDGTPRNITACP